MACAMCDVYGKDCTDTSHIGGTETNLSLGFKQAMIASEMTLPVITLDNYAKPCVDGD